MTYVHVGEDLWQTAIRETMEETGINTEFVAMLTFRHMHEYRWGTSDIYFSCLLRPLNTDITVNPSEIAAATWMDVSGAPRLAHCVESRVVVWLRIKMFSAYISIDHING